MTKICPFLKAEEVPREKVGGILQIDAPCLREECELWTEMFTTEYKRIEGCAFRFIAMKNSEGNITV